MRVLVLVFLIAISFTIERVTFARPQKEKDRAIVSEDFTKPRPRPKKRTNSGHTGKPARTYHLASAPLAKPLDKASLQTLKVGVTIWKVQQSTTTRVAADTPFHKGDLLRISIESPRAGYLYVVDRDWFTDDRSGETNLIFPTDGEDNLLEAGKVIAIPAENEPPFKTTPKLNQAGELLTIIVTSVPLPLKLSDGPIPISLSQLAQWEERWGGLNERFEMDGGVGQVRTREEQLAAASGGTRQLTRDDPAPQTIYLLKPKNANGLLFNLMLSYVR